MSDIKINQSINHKQTEQKQKNTCNLVERKKRNFPFREMDTFDFVSHTLAHTHKNSIENREKQRNQSFRSIIRFN